MKLSDPAAQLADGIRDIRQRHHVLDIAPVRIGAAKRRILVSMTRNRGTRRLTTPRSGQWALQDAKARFSEVVRKAKTEGPQKITVHGREEVVVVSVEDYRQGRTHVSGAALVQLLHDSPLGDVEIDRPGTHGNVRDVEL
jgi:prevent-host-death family protein